MSEESKGGWTPHVWIYRVLLENSCYFNSGGSWNPKCPSGTAPGTYFEYMSTIEAEALAESRAREARQTAILEGYERALDECDRYPMLIKAKLEQARNDLRAHYRAQQSREKSGEE